MSKICSNFFFLKNFLVKMYIILRYVDEDVWKTCIYSMSIKKRHCNCPTCNSVILGTVICYSSCKNWYHDSRKIEPD